MAKTRTNSHLGSVKNVQDPSTGRTSPPYRKHSTTLLYTLDPPTGLAEGGGLAASYIYTPHTTIVQLFTYHID